MIVEEENTMDVLRHLLILSVKKDWSFNYHVRQKRKIKKSSETINLEEEELFEKVVHVNRCAKVVKGGRRFSFAALVVVGDQKGNVGYGYGKAQMVPDAIRKGTEQAKKSMRSVSLAGETIPHPVLANFDGGKVLLPSCKRRYRNYCWWRRSCSSGSCRN